LVVVVVVVVVVRRGGHRLGGCPVGLLGYVHKVEREGLKRVWRWGVGDRQGGGRMCVDVCVCVGGGEGRGRGDAKWEGAGGGGKVHSSTSAAATVTVALAVLVHQTRVCWSVFSTLPRAAGAASSSNLKQQSRVAKTILLFTNNSNPLEGAADPSHIK